MKVSIKMIPVVRDAEKGTEFRLFLSKQVPDNNLLNQVVESQTKFWELEKDEVEYLRKHMVNYLKTRKPR